jgi:hypothetical protein
MRKRWWIAAAGGAALALGSLAAAVLASRALHAPLRIPAEGAWVEV